VSLHCQQQSFAGRCAVAIRRYDHAVAPSPQHRPVILPNLAKYLIELRNLKTWNQSQAANIARRKRLPVTYTAIRWIEEGKNQNPDPELLRGLASLYDTTYEDLASRFLVERYGIDLLRHDGVERSTASQGGTADVPASARRIAGLEQELEDLKAKWGEVQALAKSLFDVAVRGREGRAVARTQTSRRRTR
jgi:transcriptional regulator with XRE-family HTH domain